MSILQFLKNILIIVMSFLGFSNYGIPQEDQNIQLYQWTKNGRINLTNYETLNRNANAHFIVHGWAGSSFEAEYETMAKNYYEMNSTSNIVLVDYQKMADENYLEASDIVNITGTLLGNKIINMIRKGILQIKKIQIYGHSLGTHVSGKAARIVKSKFGDKIARISATDPAGPLFRFPVAIQTSDSVTKDDADMLDITHTSSTLRTVESFGTVDTYVGIFGVHQPACHVPQTHNSLNDLVACDHNMARAYFTESILSCGFRQTNSTASILYGQHMPLNAIGDYEMQVNAKPPYAKDPNTYPDCYVSE